MLVKVCNQVVQAIPLRQTLASSHERKIVPVDTQDFRYLRFKAIGCMEWPTAGFNGNWDGFPYEHFEDDRPGYGYKSFVNKRAHLEHNSSLGLAGSIGDLPDAFLNRFVYPISVKKWAELAGVKKTAERLAILNAPNQKDGSIEVLMRIDTKLVKSAEVDRKVRSLLDRLVRMIDTGQKLTCSMGANVEYSVCSTCGNTARFSNEYCEHLNNPARKGNLTIVPANQIRDLLDKDLLRQEWLTHLVASKSDIDRVVNGSSNKGVVVRNAELNHRVSFFELSIVGTPAFPDAKMLEKLARKQDESRTEYLRRIASELNNDEVVDLYSMLQDRGLISTQCTLS